jgi:uncharacterized membrane protein YuzA (DUF378 family)
MKASTETMTMALIAIVAAIGLIGVVAIDIVTPLQDAEGAGCQNSQAFNASQGRCFGHGP